MKRRIEYLILALSSWALAGGGLVSTAGGQDPNVDPAMEDFVFTYRIDAVGGLRGPQEGDVTPWTVKVPPPVPEFVEVEVDIVLVSRIDFCAVDPTCDGAENFFDTTAIPQVFQCNDQMDNDGDGLVDGDDPDCFGAPGWSVQVVADDGFRLTDATTAGTVAGLAVLGPPGKRDSRCANFEATGIVDPALNAGQQGAVSTVALSLCGPALLKPVGEDVVLKLTGRISTEGLEAAGDRTTPYQIRILGSDETGLTMHPENRPTSTYVVACRAATCDEVDAIASTATIALERVDSQEFRRGDADADGEGSVTDGVSILNFLFLGGTEPPCLDAADTDDSGSIDIADGVGLFNFLFLGGEAPPAPGPSQCGPDPTDDKLECLSFGACP